MESDRVLSDEEQALGISLEGDKTVLDVKLCLKYGLCTRSSSHIVERVSNYNGNVAIEMYKVPYGSLKEPIKVDARSIMGILTLAAAEDSRLKFYIDGIDEEAIQLAKDLHERVTNDELWGIN